MAKTALRTPLNSGSQIHGFKGIPQLPGAAPVDSLMRSGMTSWWQRRPRCRRSLSHLSDTHRPQRSPELLPAYPTPPYSKMSSARVARIVFVEER